LLARFFCAGAAARFNLLSLSFGFQAAYALNEPAVIPHKFRPVPGESIYDLKD
jgi:hypothetical protein